MKVEIKSQEVKVHMTANDWELYTSMRGANLIAANLNRKFERCTRNGMTRQQTETAMLQLMRKYSNFGAYDSEPLYHLKDLLRRVFPYDSSDYL